FGAAAFTVATAYAAPHEWDVGAYDECMQRVANARYCCNQSGGYWTEKWETPPNTCVASAPMQAPPAAGNTLTTDPTQPPIVRNPGSINPTLRPTLAPAG
ncbi:MAG TPA: hypothetical protein VFK56_05815, partial [Mycobacterium sp.]|nr:hypothetical protein [Mycobacterium sp.]